MSTQTSLTLEGEWQEGKQARASVSTGTKESCVCVCVVMQMKSSWLWSVNQTLLHVADSLKLSATLTQSSMITRCCLTAVHHGNSLTLFRHQWAHWRPSAGRSGTVWTQKWFISASLIVNNNICMLMMTEALWRPLVVTVIIRRTDETSQTDYINAAHISIFNINSKFPN